MIKFTIVTVTYNTADCLRKTIQSVLSQTYPDTEYLIIDGGSTDGTVSLIQEYAGRLAYWVSEPDRGIYDGMNKGILAAAALAKSDGIERYVLMLNADDTFYAQDTLSEVASFLERQAVQPDVLCGSWMLHPEHGSYLQQPGDFEQLKRRYVICHQATFVKASVLSEHLFDLKYRLAGDFHQLSGLYLAGYRFQSCPEIVICHMMLNVGATERHWVQSVREGFDVIKEHGCYHTGEMEWLLFRKWTVRTLKRLLPRRWSDRFFAWLGRHYKAM